MGFGTIHKVFRAFKKLNYLALYFIIEIQVSCEFTGNFIRNSERRKRVEMELDF
jgi:hypothetical protein